MKEERIALRANHQELQHFLKAAAMKGMSLSAFLRQAAHEKADDTLKNQDTITLSDRDRDIFLNALENPPKPNKHLKQAFKEYEQRKKGTARSHTKTKQKSRVR